MIAKIAQQFLIGERRQYGPDMCRVKFVAFLGTLLTIVTNYGLGTLFDLIHPNEDVTGHAKTA